MRPPRRPRPFAWARIAGVALLLPACAGPQSAFEGAGIDASRALDLLLVMLAGAVAVLVLVALALLLAFDAAGRAKRVIASERTIAIAGLALPIAVLSALLVYGFGILGQASIATDNALEIEVTGEQWWWRIAYRHADGARTEAANEIRVPVGRAVRLELRSVDVIHSFWVPALAGKRDLVPGQLNELVLRADTPGVYRGQCAEYCGGAHALMSLFVVAEPAPAFEAWLDRERLGAGSANAAGRDLFIAAGCGGCHTIRGTDATGRIGPDLTHVGSRLTIGAGTLRTSAAGFVEWLRWHQLRKPGNRMPPFESLSETESARIAAFLESLD